jgi:hypothetical protein
MFRGAYGRARPEGLPSRSQRPGAVSGRRRAGPCRPGPLTAGRGGPVGPYRRGLTALESHQAGHVTPFTVRASLKSGRGVISRRAARDKLYLWHFYGFGSASTLLSSIRYPAIRLRYADGPPTSGRHEFGLAFLVPRVTSRSHSMPGVVSTTQRPTRVSSRRGRPTRPALPGPPPRSRYLGVHPGHRPTSVCVRATTHSNKHTGRR